MNESAPLSAEIATPTMDEGLVAGRKGTVNVPGSSVKAKLMLPCRFSVALLLWVPTYPLFLTIGLLRALYLRIFKGKPSQILKTGTYGNEHLDDMHYPNLQLYKEPLDEPRLKKALYELCAESGMAEDKIELIFYDEQPNDWPNTGSWDIDYFIESIKGTNYFSFLGAVSKKMQMKLHVWNGEPGKPTVVYYGGSGHKWDGSSNFNFVKELMNRYMGNPPNNVFQQGNTLIAESAKAKFDQNSFICFLLKMPIYIGKNWFMILWNIARAWKCFGGNGFGFKMTAMNFTKEESELLYAGTRKLGIKPFAAFSYAVVKALKEVVGQQPMSITQQASLQTRHFPLEGQTHRDLVGDWLFGPIQRVTTEYDTKAAMAGYKELQHELDNIGPIMAECIMAKAYGLWNSGAAGFQILPTYNCWYHAMDRCVFMNNYGIRTMPEGSPFHTWNWNAPFWFGINTINVDGATTTLVGSAFMGIELVEALRDHIEATLRGIMAQAEDRVAIPTYTNAHMKQSNRA